ncbi:NADAR family protein [Limnohabitans planktonicus]|uniref:GTP cyclohydrolase n=1 Tax=Limnohabitans planktonicus II-D5 TaxID=1293045 RepID=A0A2T7UFN6_9BURK|nr:NADAR family protein [Limnohabitans planktonicus]PVE43418.1 GTP cyclohydrolase [Limnohabitans planktonicus II-D5]|eukprot:gene21500-27535_t
MRTANGMTFFWRTAEVFSNWNLGTFSVEGRAFNCAEQFMMFTKAMLFGDTLMAQRIMAEPNPRKQKMLGRQIQGYVDTEWHRQAEELMFPGLLAKFTQDQMRKAAILATGDTLLVEASPDDAIWGIGLEETDPRCMNPNEWLGQNKLGRVLTRVRDAIKANEANQVL